MSGDEIGAENGGIWHADCCEWVTWPCRRISGEARMAAYECGIHLWGVNGMIATTGASSSGDLQANYMSLLVTQLQNQNPLEPMNNNDMSAQLAQYSQLEQLENMNSPSVSS